MKKNETIIQSLVKGVVISCILVFFQIAFSGQSSDDNHIKIIKFETSQNMPAESGAEVKVSVQPSSLHSIGHIEVSRETLYLLEVLLSANIQSDEPQLLVPLPLSVFLQTLFTSAISVNAP
jgi:hypothetical protein